MLYLETSALVAYTLAREREKQRYVHMIRLIALLQSGEIEGATSFYALHELYVITMENAAESWQGFRDGTDVLLEILQTGILVLPMLTRQQRLIHSRPFRHMQDSSDIVHAALARCHQCTAIVTYDRHFQAVADIIPCKSPDELIAEVGRSRIKGQ